MAEDTTAGLAERVDLLVRAVGRSGVTVEQARRKLTTVMETLQQQNRRHMKEAGMPPCDVDAAMELIDSGHASADNLIALWRAMTL